MISFSKNSWESSTNLFSEILYHFGIVIFFIFLILSSSQAKADELKSKAAVYGEQAEAILSQIEFDREDLEKTTMDCTSAVITGGFGPICDAAARDASELIKNFRGWIKEAENLKPADVDKEFHEEFIENIKCQRDMTILDRDIARITQIRDLKKSLDLQQQKANKHRICFKLNLKISLGLIDIKCR